jgi:cyclophilin family peptidyl-prolyl cis-trans isomerase
MWDRKYTVFGRVIKGMSDVKLISTAPTRPGTVNPSPKIVIKTVTLRPRASVQ